MKHRQDNETPALNALTALRGAPISMGRGEIPVELCQQPSVYSPFLATNNAVLFQFGKEDTVISSDALARMRQQNIKEINKDDLVDIRSVVVDTSLPPEQRMMDYLEKIKNPYCFRCGDAVVSIHFADKGNSLDSLLKNYFLGLKRS